MSSILITGCNGLIGSRFLQTFSKEDFNLVTPNSSEFNITNYQSITKYINNKKTDFLINFAGFTNLEKAEKDRGNKQGLSWMINAEGPKNLSKLCVDKNIFLIHISTDAVFSGTNTFPGPYSEDIIPEGDPKTLSWYGYTKYIGEQEILSSRAKAAIIRISYPFGNKDSQKDFANKMINYIYKNYPLFSDQNFTPTFIDDLTITLEKIVKNNAIGIYHVATHPLTTPLEFGTFIAQLKNYHHPLKRGLLTEYLKEPGVIPRSQFGGLLTEKAQNVLDVKFSSWKTTLIGFLKS